MSNDLITSRDEERPPYRQWYIAQQKESKRLAELLAQTALDRDQIEQQLAAAKADNARLREALKAYMFVEQTRGGLNPHELGTNRHRAFELGRAALAKEDTHE